MSTGVAIAEALPSDVACTKGETTKLLWVESWNAPLNGTGLYMGVACSFNDFCFCFVLNFKSTPIEA
jgi:hypothetical protein